MISRFYCCVGMLTMGFVFCSAPQIYAAELIGGFTITFPWPGEQGDIDISINLDVIGDIDDLPVFDVSQLGIDLNATINNDISNLDFDSFNLILNPELGFEEASLFGEFNYDFIDEDWSVTDFGLEVFDLDIGQDSIQRIEAFLQDADDIDFWNEIPDNPVEKIPEPLTVLGSLTAVGWGCVMKRKFRKTRA